MYQNRWSLCVNRWPSAPHKIAPGLRCPGVCSTVDLIATLLDLCSIPSQSVATGFALPCVLRPPVSRFVNGMRVSICTCTVLALIVGLIFRPLDGHSLAEVMSRGGTSIEWKDEALCEYLAHGVISPNAMLRVGRYKLVYSHGDPPALFDVVS